MHLPHPQRLYLLPPTVSQYYLMQWLYDPIADIKKDLLGFLPFEVATGNCSFFCVFTRHKLSSLSCTIPLVSLKALQTYHPRACIENYSEASAQGDGAV